jgi:hypothetical protein
VDESEGVEAFHRHCDFFITSMLEGQEGLDWLNSPMYFYFKQEFPVRIRLDKPEHGDELNV